VADDPLQTVESFRRALLRLVGTEEQDPEFSLRGEVTNEVLDLFLSEGTWAAQRWLLRNGYKGWRSRSPALVWLGADATDGGRYAAMPTDFLTAYSSGEPPRGALVEADGSSWGQEIAPDDLRYQGNGYYFPDTSNVWLARRASPPSPIYLLYHYRHPGWVNILDADLDLPQEVRYLVVAEAASQAKEEHWLPGGQEMEMKIERALGRARQKAMGLARPSGGPRKMRHRQPYGYRW
jgi:hypothetical protein